MDSLNPVFGLRTATEQANNYLALEVPLAVMINPVGVEIDRRQSGLRCLFDLFLSASPGASMRSRRVVEIPLRSGTDRRTGILCQQPNPAGVARSGRQHLANESLGARRSDLHPMRFTVLLNFPRGLVP